MIKPGNLLIVRTDRIGDVVLTLPLARIIKKYYPGCRITFLVRQYTSGLVENHPYIDSVLVLKEAAGKPSVGENVKMIAAGKFDCCIVVHPTFKISLIAFLSRIRERIGTGYRWYSFLFNNKIYQHRKYAEKHELEFNVQLLEHLGINENVTPDSVEFDLKPGRAENEEVAGVLREENAGQSGNIIIIHPGSGGSAVDLPEEKFSELAEILSGKNNVEVFLTGNENERELCERITTSGNIKNFAGRFTLNELTALIGLSDFFISNSTGPLHIAAALGKNVIGFYPKITACLPERWGPYSDKSVVFKPKIECSNCTREQCEKLRCMNTIEMREVVSLIESKLKNKAEK